MRTPSFFRDNGTRKNIVDRTDRGVVWWKACETLESRLLMAADLNGFSTQMAVSAAGPKPAALMEMATAAPTFDSNSADFSNVPFLHTAGGSGSVAYTGFADTAGETFQFSYRTDTMLGIKVLHVQASSELWIARDTQGVIWLLEEIDHDRSDHQLLFQANSLTQVVKLTEAFDIDTRVMGLLYSGGATVGAHLEVGGETATVVSTNASLSTYPNSLFVKVHMVYSGNDPYDLYLHGTVGLVNEEEIPNGIDAESASHEGWQIANFTSNIQNAERLVNHLYRDVLARDPDAEGLTNWTTALKNGTITSAQIASGFTNSVEYRSNRIQAIYQSILGRAAEPAGLQSWLNYFATGHTIEQMKAGFYGSAEYYAKKGSTNSAVVTAYYREILGREPDSGGLASWTTQLNNGASRTVIAYGIMSGSVEGAAKIVRACYTTYLLRNPDDAGLQSWITQVRNGVSEFTLIAGFLGSPEYINRA